MVRSRLLPAFLSAMLAFTFCVPVAYADGGLRSAAAGDLTAQSANIASGTSGTCTWVIDKDGLLTIKPTNGKSGTLAEPSGSSASSWPWSEYTSEGSSGSQQSTIKKVRVEKGVTAGKSVQYLFSWLDLTEADISNLDTSSTEDVSYMFTHTTVQKKLTFNTSTDNVLSMEGMFYLAWLRNGMQTKTWNTSKVTDMSWMFWNSGYEEYAKYDFDTSSVEVAWNMFRYKSFGTLDISSFGTSTNGIAGAFDGCTIKNRFQE